MTTRPLPSNEAFPHPPGLRRQAAWLLRGASVMLGRLARRLRRRAPAAIGEPMLEFYAEAGAPEGALYLDGRLIGHLDGVRRL